MYSSGPTAKPIDASSTSLAVPPHTDPDSLTTVVTLPSVVMVPTQVVSPESAAGSGEQANASAAARRAQVALPGLKSLASLVRPHPELYSAAPPTSCATPFWSRSPGCPS